MTVLRKTRAFDRSLYSGTAILVMVWILAIHVVGWVMGRVFTARVGFAPVWFFDCTACIPVGPSLPRGTGPFAGMSMLVVAAEILAVVLSRQLRRGTQARTHQLLATAAGTSMSLFAIAAFLTRYPGSLPAVTVAVVPAVVAASLFFAASGPVEGQVVGPYNPPPISTRARAAMALGTTGIAVLGGLISVAAVIAGALAWESAPDARSQRYAGLAVLLGIASGILRWAVLNRYDWLGPIV